MKEYLISDTGRKFSVDRKDQGLMPLISVVVPIFGAGSTLEEALTSIELQTFQNIEIVCVNDASKDESERIIQEHASGDLRYTIVSHAENAGYGASMNDGIMAARGKWIAILEPDDYILPDMYQSMVDVANDVSDLSDLDVIKTPYIRELREEGTPRGGTPKGILNCSYRYRIKPKSQPFCMLDENVQHLLRHHPSIWSAIYRKSFLRENQIGFVEYPGSGWADNEFFYKTLLSAKNIVYLDEPFYVYREETDMEFANAARKNKELAFDRWDSMLQIIKDLDIEDKGVWKAHIAKGFTYIKGQLDANGEEDEITDLRIERMFAQMPKDIVLAETNINPDLKRRYIDHALSHGEDISERDIRRSNIAYKKGLVGELVYTMRNNGIKYSSKLIAKTIR